MKQDSSKDGKKKKKSTYKTKRSFTRNKKLRSDEPGRPGGGFKKDFSRRNDEGDSKKSKARGANADKDKRGLNKDKRAERKEMFAGRGRRDDARRGNEGADQGDKRKGFKKDFRERGSEGGFKKEFRERRSEGGFKKDFRERGSEGGFKKEFRERGSEGGFKKERRERSPEGGFKKDFRGREGDRGFKKEFRERKTGDRFKKDFDKKPSSKPTYAEKGLIRLNRYIANAGVCSRREADDLIATGCVTVNGKIVTELGYKVKQDDVVTYSGQRLKTEKHVYLLLNKPKDYITTADDERGRRTVMDLIAGAVKERVYPVGRLDRNTTGLLLFTNDGEMAKKLTHPQHRVQKLYHVELDKNLKHDDLLKIQEGIELEDGFIKPDEVAYAGESKREVGILIHSGRNRIVRRIFETLGYDVLRLDRVMFAGLTKKDLPRGHWRMLTDKEIAFLKMA
jgi:23S rRNA pseudouridine2605 synthase